MHNCILTAVTTFAFPSRGLEAPDLDLLETRAGALQVVGRPQAEPGLRARSEGLGARHLDGAVDFLTRDDYKVSKNQERFLTRPHD